MTTLELPGIRKLRSGKVREVFEFEDKLLIVATDRISAFDVILPTPIPGKGEVLTQLSAFWFRMLDLVPNHLVTAEIDRMPDALRAFERELRGRAMLAARAEPLPVECVVRGYLVGSGWKEYRESGTIAGQRLPEGLRQAERLPEPIFTPSTKAEVGHDENISWERCCDTLGADLARRVRDISIALYDAGRTHAAARGIVIADTKFEFGLRDGQLLLIDECLTPDSSRFWPASDYRIGMNPTSFDKQFVRDYLESLDWDKTPPGPELPAEIVEKTAEKYREAHRRITGPVAGT